MAFNQFVTLLGLLFALPMAGAVVVPKFQAPSLVQKAHVFKHNSPRLMIYSQNFPWRAIGKLVVGIGKTEGCTASLVAEDLILTNRHCVEINKAIHTGAFYFFPMLNGDFVHATPYLAMVVDNGPDIVANNDWALLQLTTPIGKKLGYLGVDRDGERLPDFNGEQTLPEAFEVDLCRNTRSPFEFLRLAQRNGAWLLEPSVPHRPLVCMAGFPGDLGGSTLALSSQCGLLGQNGNQFREWLHDCPGSKGTSGSPMFYREGSSFFIAALNSGESPGATPGNSLIYVPFGSNNFNAAGTTDSFFAKIKAWREKTKN